MPLSNASIDDSEHAAVTAGGGNTADNQGRAAVADGECLRCRSGSGGNGCQLFKHDISFFGLTTYILLWYCSLTNETLFSTLSYRSNIFTAWLQLDSLLRICEHRIFRFRGLLRPR